MLHISEVLVILSETGTDTSPPLSDVYEGGTRKKEKKNVIKSDSFPMLSGNIVGGKEIKLDLCMLIAFLKLKYVWQ